MLLTAGEAISTFVKFVGDTDGFEGVVGSGGVLGPNQGPKRFPEGPLAKFAGVDVVDDPEVIDEVELLVNGTDRLLGVAQLVGSEMVKGLAEEGDISLVGHEGAVEDADEGAFARATGTDEGKAIAGIEGESDINQCRGIFELMAHCGEGADWAVN